MVPNGDCARGAENMSNIKAIGREQTEQNRRLNVLEARWNWFMVLLVTTLVVGLINLLLDVRQAGGL